MVKKDSMGIYYINEYSDEMSLIELRLGGIKDCELYIQKVIEILDFLRFHAFLALIQTFLLLRQLTLFVEAW